MTRFLVSFVLAALAGPLWGATKTVTLRVPDMNCAACPITVKKALGKVPGIIRTEVSLERREAVVTFDEAKATVADLTRATLDAGYPSTVAGSTR